MQNLILSFQVGMVSISADPRHLAEEIFIIYLINNSSRTTLTLSDLKMTVLHSVFWVWNETLNASPKTKKWDENVDYHLLYYIAKNIYIDKHPNSFHSHQHTQNALNIPSGSWRCISQSCCFSSLNCFCLPLSWSLCSCFSVSSALYKVLVAQSLSLPFPRRFSGLND